MSTADVVVAGHICIDLTPNIPEAGTRGMEDVVRAGSLTVVGPCTVSTGGPVANTGLALKKLGLDVVLMGKVGDDSFGGLVEHKLAEQGCAGGVVCVPGEQTSYTIVVAPPGVDRAFLHNPGANDTFCADDVDYERVARTRLFHFGYPPMMRRLYEDEGRELIEIFRRAREAGATTSLDMVLPDPAAPSGRMDWDAILQKLLPYVDLFLPSAEEVFYFLDREGFFENRGRAAEHGVDPLDLIGADVCTRLSGRLIEYGAGTVALKSGHRGVYLHTAGARRLDQFGRARPGDPAAWADRNLWKPAFAVERMVNATGSGDCAIAGFLAAYLRGESPEDALRMAVTLGYQNILVQDAVSGVTSYEDADSLSARLEPGLLAVDADGWDWDDNARIWRGEP
jgi:sugar/nucleoside kinase (ribokinase family)